VGPADHGGERGGAIGRQRRFDARARARRRVREDDGGGVEEVAARAGGRTDEWRFREPLPPLLQILDKAAGLDHRELTVRSMWLPGGAA